MALITADEHGRLLRNEMPAGWDGADVFARYTGTGIQLEPNSLIR